MTGHVPAHAQSARVDLHNGWQVEAFTSPPAEGVLRQWHALALMIGGVMLSLLFGLLVGVLGTGRRRALALVLEKTRELPHRAFHDALTGLPNRALVLDRASSSWPVPAVRDWWEPCSSTSTASSMSTTASGTPPATPAEDGRRAAHERPARLRYRRSARRRGVRDPARHDGASDTPERVAEPCSRGPREPIALGASSEQSSRSVRASGSPRGHTRPRTSCSATPTSRCTPRRRPGKDRYVVFERGMKRCPKTTCSSRPTSTTRSKTSSSSSSTSRCSTCAARRSPAWRR